MADVISEFNDPQYFSNRYELKGKHVLASVDVAGNTFLSSLYW